MVETKVMFESTEVEKDVKGSSEFNFWRVFTGFFGDLKGLANDINAATEAAYSEGDDLL